MNAYSGISGIYYTHFFFATLEYFINSPVFWSSQSLSADCIRVCEKHLLLCIPFIIIYSNLPSLATFTCYIFTIITVIDYPTREHLISGRVHKWNIGTSYWNSMNLAGFELDTFSMQQVLVISFTVMAITVATELYPLPRTLALFLHAQQWQIYAIIWSMCQRTNVHAY